MKKVMFDSNAFSSLLNSEFDWTSFFAHCNKQYDFYVTAVQIEELAEISDKNKETRIRHLLCLCEMRAKMVTTTLVLGYSRFGFSSFGDEGDPTYESLLNENRSNVCDAMIGEAAKRENCILITDDKRFTVKLHANGILTMTFKEFCDSIFEHQ